MASTTLKSPIPAAVTGEIGHFDASKLKHAETQEKNPLPTKEGQYCLPCWHTIVVPCDRCLTSGIPVTSLKI